MPRNGAPPRRGLLYATVGVAAAAPALPAALYLTAPAAEASATTATTAAAAATTTTIVGDNSGLCLSVSGASTSPGATADIYTCNGSVSENWTVNSTGTITGNNSGLCLSVSGASGALKAVADTSAINLRNQAIAQLEQEDSGLQVSYTLPVLPTGLTSQGVAILQSAKTYGASIAAVNVMAMDYGGSFPGNMATLAEQAATSTAAQVSSVWTTLSSAQALAKVAVTPMIGVNDAGISETFSLADAATLANWAKANGLAWTSFWSATRDSECSGGAESYAEDDCSSIVQSAGAFGKAFSAVYY
jgi:hypothetical protein